MIIDLHNHYFPLDIIEHFPDDIASATTRADGNALLSVNGHTLPLDRRLFDVEQQLADMHAQGIDGKSLMVPPFTFLYELPSDIGTQWSVAINDGIAKTASNHPDVFFGFATLPLQDVAASIAELDRAIVTLGLAGVEIATSINELPLDDESLLPFWSRCQELRIPVLIHPHYVSGAERMSRYHLRNLIGNPAETSLAGATLLFGGVLERFPDLRIVLSHGGGALPHLIGRLRQGFAMRSECQVHSSDPVGQLSHLYYDTIVFDQEILRNVTNIVGTSQLVLGTDYPFDMSESGPVEFVRNSGLSDQSVGTILESASKLVSRA